MSDEVIPDSVTHSKNSPQDLPPNLAIDLDLETWCSTAKNANDESWFKISFEQEQCIKQVKRFRGIGDIYIWEYLYYLSMFLCIPPNEVDIVCGEYTLTVSTEGASGGQPPSPDCKYADTVILERRDSGSITIKEISIIAKQGNRLISPKRLLLFQCFSLAYWT